MGIYKQWDIENSTREVNHQSGGRGGGVFDFLMGY